MIGRIQYELLKELPAWEAQQKMAPPLRKPLSKQPLQVRLSAVCILLFYKNEELHTILIRRTQDGKTHGGQISFPGGRFEANDFSFTYCAQRECEEEIGLAISEMKVLGAMSQLYIPPSNYMVYPVVMFSHKVEDLIASVNEVDEIIEVPLKKLFDDSCKKRIEVEASSNKVKIKETPIYQFESYVIWGATAMILSEFEEIYNRLT